MFEKSFSFLKAIKKNNNREWYHANKAQYQEAKTEFEHIIELLIHEVSRFDSSVAGLTPKDCIFRIFRDVRFSKDKSPYKTHFGAFIVPGGKKNMNAGYYIHVEPGGGSLIAAGIYMPPSDVLRAIRNDIYNHAEEFMEIIESDTIQKEFGEMDGDKLKNPPQGFPKDFHAVEYLKYKSYGVLCSKTDIEIQDNESIQEVVRLFKLAMPVVRFLNEAIKS